MPPGCSETAAGTGSQQQIDKMSVTREMVPAQDEKQRGVRRTPPWRGLVEPHEQQGDDQSHQENKQLAENPSWDWQSQSSSSTELVRRRGHGEFQGRGEEQREGVPRSAGACEVPVKV